jgi:hypothetical protein
MTVLFELHFGYAIFTIFYFVNLFLIKVLIAYYLKKTEEEMDFYGAIMEQLF